MKAIKKFLSDEFYVAMTVTALFVFTCVSYAAITAPESARPGELVKVMSDVEADWVVQPDEYNQTAYIDSNRKTLVLANPKPGTVYIFAATTDAETKEPKAFCWKLEISEQAPTGDEVIPPKPIEIGFPQTVTDAINSVDSPNKEKEKTDLLDVLKSTVAFINNGSVTTTAGARETIRRNWILKANSVSKDTETLWAPVLIQIFKPLNDTDLQKVKGALNECIKAMEEMK